MFVLFARRLCQTGAASNAAESPGGWALPTGLLHGGLPTSIRQSSRSMFSGKVQFNCTVPSSTVSPVDIAPTLTSAVISRIKSARDWRGFDRRLLLARSCLVKTRDSAHACSHDTAESLKSGASPSVFHLVITFPCDTHFAWLQI